MLTERRVSTKFCTALDICVKSTEWMLGAAGLSQYSQLLRASGLNTTCALLHTDDVASALKVRGMDWHDALRCESVLLNALEVRSPTSICDKSNGVTVVFHNRHYWQSIRPCQSVKHLKELLQWKVGLPVEDIHLYEGPHSLCEISENQPVCEMSSSQGRRLQRVYADACVSVCVKAKERIHLTRYGSGTLCKIACICWSIYF